MSIRRSRPEKTFQAFNYIFLGILCIATIYPFWNLVAIAFSGPSPLKLHQVFLVPLEPQIDALRYLFDNPLYWQW